MMTVEDTRYISLNTQHGVSRPTANDYVKSYLSHVDFSFLGLLKEDEDILYNHIDIVNAQIPVSFYNINYNSNILKYSMNNGTVKTLTITRGNYLNITSLIQTLRSEFLLAGYTFTITFNSVTGKLLFSSNQNFSFFSVGSTILETIGFDSVSNYSSTNNILYSDHPCSLIGIKKLKVSSIALQTNAVSSGGGGDLLGIIPVDKPPYSLITYQNTGSRKALLKNRVIDSIDIKITDENNGYVNFNNVEWSLTLAITTTRKYKENIFTDLFRGLITSQTQNDSGGGNPIDTTTTNPNGDTSNLGNLAVNDEETDLDLWMYKHGILTGG